jgi:COMPASS component SWD2
MTTHDNKFLRYFLGHTAPVTSLEFSPGSDTFISCSLDNTVRLWDIRSQHAQGKLSLKSPHTAAFDPSASVIAIASASTSTILLYDYRNYDRPPFSTFDIIQPVIEHAPDVASKGWTKLEFSNDGKSLLLGTVSGGHFLIDAFDGTLKAFCTRPRGPTGRAAPGGARTKDGGVDVQMLGQGDVCFSADGRYLIGGHGKENLCVWDTHAAPQGMGVSKVMMPTTELQYRGRSSVVAFNPRFNIFCTADREVVFWLPDLDAKAN